MGLASRFALLFFDYVFSQLTFGRERAAIDNAKAIFMLLIGQVTTSLFYVLPKFSIAPHLWVAQRGCGGEGGAGAARVARGGNARMCL